MKKLLIILGSLVVVLTFVISGFSEGPKTRKIASASQVEGKWTGFWANFTGDSRLSLIVESNMISGVITGTTPISHSYPCSGYIDNDSGKVIIFIGERHGQGSRGELKLSEDGTKLIGDEYEFAFKRGNAIEFARTK